MVNRKAFTLIEVLISIGLMGMILVTLFSTVDMLQNSNENLLEYLKKSKKMTKATKILYNDILSSDGNLTIQKDEFSRLCLEETKNSLYALPIVKVCWVVLKKENRLARIEGNNYSLPSTLEEKVEVDIIMNDVTLFDIYHKKDKVLVLLQQEGKEPISFLLQGVRTPVAQKKTKKNNKNRKPPVPSPGISGP